MSPPLNICLGNKRQPEVTLKPCDQLSVEQLEVLGKKAKIDLTRTSISLSPDHAMLVTSHMVRSRGLSFFPSNSEGTTSVRLEKGQSLQIVDPATSRLTALTLRLK